MDDEKLERRTRTYVQRPKEYEIPGCQECGNSDPDWSEFKGRLWCQNCKVDFVPASGGLFDGPISVKACELLGIYFDEINLDTGTLEPDPFGVSHFSSAEARKLEGK